jgi:hypothetical protein
VGEVNNVPAALNSCKDKGVFFNFCGKFPGIDAFVRPACKTLHVDVFNFTITTTHEINFDAIAALNEGLVKGGEASHMFLNFVVPETKFDLWTNQQSFRVETVHVKLKNGETIEWEGKFEAGLPTTYSTIKASKPLNVILTPSHVEVIFDGYIYQLSRAALVKSESAKLHGTPFIVHFVSKFNQKPLAELSASLQKKVEGVTQRVISLRTTKPTKPMREFSTLTTGHRISLQLRAPSCGLLPLAVQVTRRLFK